MFRNELASLKPQEREMHSLRNSSFPSLHPANVHRLVSIERHSVSANAYFNVWEVYCLQVLSCLGYIL